MAYYNVEPFGPERNDLASAIIAHVCATGFANGKRRFKLTDFLPDFSCKAGGPGKEQQMRKLVQGLKDAWSNASGNRR